MAFTTYPLLTLYVPLVIPLLKRVVYSHCLLLRRVYYNPLNREFLKLINFNSYEFTELNASLSAINESHTYKNILYNIRHILMCVQKYFPWWATVVVVLQGVGRLSFLCVLRFSISYIFTHFLLYSYFLLSNDHRNSAMLAFLGILLAKVSIKP